MKRKLLALLLALVLCASLLPICASAATSDYTQWKQFDPDWGNVVLWPNAQYPTLGGGGCWITSVAILLRHYNVVSDSNVNTFNPLICAKKLMDYGIVNAYGDWQNLSSMNNAYPGFSYAGSMGYSLNNLKKLYNQGYACVVHETKGHYVAIRSVSGDTVSVMDPGSSYTTSLSASDSIQYFKVSPQYTYEVTDFDSVVEVKCSSKPAYLEPYEASSVTRTIKNGDLVTITGYTYNKYGNLWYRTAYGDYIYYENLELDTMVKYLPPSNYVHAIMKVQTPDGMSRPIRSSPYWDGELLGNYNKGDIIEVTHYLYSSNGNLWYKTASGGYVYFAYLDVLSSDGWIPSDYIEGTVKLQADSKPVHEGMYSKTKTKYTLNKGDLVDIKGYAYNSYGNLWYVIGEDTYVFFDWLKNIGTTELPGDYYHTTLVVTAPKNIFDGTYWGTKNTELSPLTVGTKLNTISYLHNRYGTIYYEVEGEKYVDNENLAPYYFKINFDANGGKGKMSSIDVVYDEVFNLPKCTFTREGYRFVGWNATRLCDGKSYVAGHGWNTDNEIKESGYVKSIYQDEWNGFINNSWANNLVDANEYTLYAVWEKVGHIHQYEAKTTPPTCTEQGYTTYTCSCGDSYKGDYKAPLGHNYGSNGVCTRCGEKNPNYKQPNFFSSLLDSIRNIFKNLFSWLPFC